VESYNNSLEHLLEELQRIDLLIRLQILRWRTTDQSGTDEFRGLCITEAEIDTMLAGDNAFGTRLESAPSPLDPLLDSYAALEATIAARKAASRRSGIVLRLERLQELFHLSSFDIDVLLVCLAPELDRTYEKLYAYLQDDVTRKKPSVDLVLTLLCQTMQEKLAARLTFEPQAPLLKYRLVHITDGSPDGPTPLLSRFLKLDDRIVNFLLGFGQLDARLVPFTQLVSPQVEPDQVLVSAEVQSRLGKFVRLHCNGSGAAERNIVCYFYGPYGSGKRSLVEALCHDLGLCLVRADARKMLEEPLAFGEMMWLLGREAVLQSAALCLENVDSLLADTDKHQSQLQSLLEALQTFSRLTFLLGRAPWRPQELATAPVFIALECPAPDERARKHLWECGLNRHSQCASDVDLGALASKFRFTPGQIRDALVAAQTLACWRSPDNGQITMTNLYAACRAQSNPKLSTLARKIEPRYTWDDMVLPPDQCAQLHEICHQVNYRHIVFGAWGFDRKLSLGKGLNVLFSGPPGTGKTMAAEVIANALQLDLYKIDLSQVVSKYIGETEKNLDHIFTAAESANAILFFDEADALFGKRSEVKDAHDRYANIEVGYLLQKMEEYEGIAILATNLRQHLDEAFVRRMQIIVEFPFPDEEYRRRIWDVVFPRAAPLGDDVDFCSLARAVKLAGGNIKNIAVAAAFYAAEEGGRIHMPHLVRAARREHQKLGRAWNGEEWSAKGVSVS
jgi:AAA+ superfamily predicted ATPase